MAEVTQRCSFCGVSQPTAGLIRGETELGISHLCGACLDIAQTIRDRMSGSVGPIVEARNLVIHGVALVWSAYLAGATFEQPSVLINVRREDQEPEDGIVGHHTVGGVLPCIVIPNEAHVRNFALAFADHLGLKPKQT